MPPRIQRCPRGTHTGKHTGCMCKISTHICIHKHQNMTTGVHIFCCPKGHRGNTVFSCCTCKKSSTKALSCHLFHFTSVLKSSGLSLSKVRNRSSLSSGCVVSPVRPSAWKSFVMTTLLHSLSFALRLGCHLFGKSDLNQSKPTRN